MGLACESDSDGARSAVAAVKKMASDVNLPDFGSLGVKAEDLEALAENSFRNGSNGSNPRPMTRDDYLRVLKGMMSLDT
jgi:alcohol dehydrogenase